MLRRQLASLIVLLLVAAPGTARADQTDDYVAAAMRTFHLPGLSLAVVQNGTIVKVAGYGVADVARQTKATPETVFRIGSISKQYLATAIVLLDRDGRLRVDDSIVKYFPDAPASWKPITIRHLLAHTSGIVRESPAFDPTKDVSDVAIVRGAYDGPLLFTPGERWAYSNVGYSALAEIIRIASGGPWTTFIAQRIFEPAGLTTTAPTNVKPTLPNRATGYTGNDNANVAEEWVALRPSGAFLSTVLDLAKWDAALYSDKVLDAAARRRMWTPVALNDGKTYPYGYAWHVEDWSGRRVVWHGGGQPGFTSQFLRFLDEGLTIIVLANGDDVDTASIASRVALFYMPQPTPSAAK